MSQETIYRDALVEIKKHIEQVAGPKLCKTNTVWKICDKVLHDHEKAVVIESREKAKSKEA